MTKIALSGLGLYVADDEARFDLFAKTGTW